MPGMICKQPNGLYCRFSTVVDTFTHINMTEQDYIDYCKDRAMKEAERDARDVLKRWLHPLAEAKQRFQPNNNTVEEFNEMLKEMGDTELLDPDDYEE